MRISRQVCVKIYAADIPKLLSDLSENGIVLEKIEFVDLITANVAVSYTAYQKLKEYLNSGGVTYEVLRKSGTIWSLFSLLNRPVLVIGCILFFFLSLTVSNRVLFVTVRGNTESPARFITEQAEASGVRFWCKRKTINSEEVKNRLLEQIPQLQWVGVNITGCVAVIHVAEDAKQSECEISAGEVGSIVAKTDGVICDLTALNGTAICAPGDRVKKGETLISGYTDCGIKVQAQVAKGEVYAYTHREIELLALYPAQKKGNVLSVHRCIALKFGKKEINLCNHSGIYSACCDKMYLEEYWTLPGGYQLPVALIRFVCFLREPLDPNVDMDTVTQFVNETAEAYLDQQMIAGKILTKETTGVSCDDFYMFTGSYACKEMIGQLKYEETIIKHAEDN